MLQDMNQKLDRIKNLWGEYWITFVIAIQPILDITVFFTQGSSFDLIALIIRMLILIGICLGVFFILSKKDKAKIIVALLPLGLFMIAHLVVSNSQNIGDFYHDFKYMVTVMQLPILAVVFSFYSKYKRNIVEQIKIGFLCSAIVIATSIVLSLILGNTTYTYDGYGITGWFTSRNTQSMILIAVFPIFMLVALQSNKVGFTFLALAMNGTRSCYYALVILFIVMLYNAIVEPKTEKKKKVFKTVICLGAVIASLVFYMYSPTEIEQQNRLELEKEYELSDEEKEEKLIMDKIERIKYFEKQEEYQSLSDKEIEGMEYLCASYIYVDLMKLKGIKPVVREMQNDLTPKALMDVRKVKRVYSQILFYDASLSTKLFGLNFARINENSYDMENDLTAIYHYYGYLGFAVYLGYLGFFLVLGIKMVIKNWKNIFDMELVTYGFTFLMLVAAGEYSGAFLRKPNANVYLAFILALVYQKSTELLKTDELMIESNAGDLQS